MATISSSSAEGRLPDRQAGGARWRRSGNREGDALLKRVMVLGLLLLAACGPGPGAPPGGASGATTRPPAPSATPSPAPTAGLDSLPRPPEDLSGLDAWLAEAWRLGPGEGEVRRRLSQAGWLEPDGWRSADLDGDGRRDWIVRGVAPAQDLDRGYLVRGRLLLVGAWGVREARAGESWSVPALEALADLSGDGRPEAVLHSESCGAHTCFSSFQVWSAHQGEPRQILRPVSQEGMASAGVELVDATGDGLADLVLTGGTIGSVGAGPQRARIEVWAWDGRAISLAREDLEPALYRVHVLYEANDAFDRGDVQAARSLYQRVIEDERLEDAQDLLGGESRGEVKGLAAFRLALIHLQLDEPGRAATWTDWLEREHPGRPMTRAGRRLLEAWGATGDLGEACAEVTALLEGEDRPTGGLAEMGYVNPSLGAADVCPVR